MRAGVACRTDQSKLVIAIAAASMPSVFMAVDRPAPERGIREHRSLLFVAGVEPHRRAAADAGETVEPRLSAATPPTGRPCDQSHTRASSCSMEVARREDRSSVLSPALTAAAAGANAARRGAARGIGDDRPARPQI